MRSSGPTDIEGRAGTAAHFLDGRRLAVYPRLFLVVYVIAGAAWLLQSPGLVDPMGKPLGYDFITFWSASFLGLSGEPEAAYDIERIYQVQQAVVPGSNKMFLWNYPPMFQLVVLPLALLPYILSYLVWIASTGLACIAAVRRLAPAPQTLWLLLAFPGTFINLFHGQNGFLTAALFGGAMALLERRPAGAGILIGLLTLKPQLGLLLPVALLCGRQWTAFLAASITATAFALLSTAVVGVESWFAFWNNLPVVRLVLETGLLPWAKMPSLFATLRLLDVSAPLAYALQGLLAAAVATVVAWVWCRKAPIPLAAAVLVSGSLLISPYLFDYDLVLLAIPIALLAWDGYRRGWLPGEREVLVLAWLAPMVIAPIAEHSGLQLGAACLLALFVVAVRRALCTDAAPNGASV